MNGSDFLDKLGDLDPALVASAAEPPAPRARRGPDWGSLAAAAACILAICLPLALTYLIRGVTPTVEYGPGAKGGGTSHQASPGEDGPEGGNGLGSDRQPNKGTGDGPTASYSTLPKPQERVMGYGDEYTWTQYTLYEEYCAAYPDGLPVEEYFKYNVQGLDALPELWGGLLYEAEAFDTSYDSTHQWVRDFSGLLSENYTEPTISADLSGENKRISIQTKYGISWRDDGYDSRLTVDICETSPVGNTQLDLIRARSNETAAVFPKDSHGERKIVFALGGLDSDRCLYTWLPYTGIWCRIAAGASVPVGDMAAILDWLLSLPDMLGEINPLASFSPELYPFVPAPKTNDYAPPIYSVGGGLEGEPGQNQSEHTVQTLDVSYQPGWEGRPLERFRISRRNPSDSEEESMGGLTDLTRDEVSSQYLLQKRAMTTSRSSNRNMDSQPMRYTFHFLWGDFYVIATFSEDLTEDELWGFIQQLSLSEQPSKGGALIAKE